MALIKLKKSTVEALPFTEMGQKVYFDTELRGFLLCVGRRTKTYYAQRQMGAKTVRVKIGGHDVYAADRARDEARLLIARMLRGENPNETKRVDHAKSITLEEAFQKYLVARDGLRDTTKQTYRRIVFKLLAPWRSTPLAAVTPAAVHEAHIRLTGEYGATNANTAMRVFRAIYNYAAAFHDGLPANPVNRLTQARAWNREVRRQTIISPGDLPRWYETVTGLSNPLARDYLYRDAAV